MLLAFFDSQVVRQIEISGRQPRVRLCLGAIHLRGDYAFERRITVLHDDVDRRKGLVAVIIRRKGRRTA